MGIAGSTPARLLSALVAIALLFSLSGCAWVQQIPLPQDLLGGSGTAQPTPSAQSSPSASAVETAEPTDSLPPPASAEPRPAGDPLQTLTVWVPPEFDPGNGTPAGNLLRERLREFSRQNGGVRVQVRVKASTGPGGLLESLNAASAAAPLSLPSVVALSRADLEVAALKGLVFPLDGVSTAIDQPDWYDYAHQLAMVQGATFSLPFAGDALIIAYRPGKVVAPPANWETILRLSQPLAFPAGDAQGLFPLALYQSIGGAVEDAQRRPTLQPEVLSQVLQVLADGEQRSVFPYWLAQYETNGQVWQAYQDGRVNAIVTWVSNYLINLPPDTSAVAVPSLDDTPQALATGWGWAIADPDPDRRALSVKLAEFISDGTFLAAWTEAAGYLPTRPSALTAWTNQSFKTLLSPVAVSAQARPSVEQLASLGPVLKEATLKVIKRESDPTQAAQAATERLTVPENR